MENRIKKIRVSRGWSQEKLAQAVIPASTRQQIARLETGQRRLTMEWLTSLATALRCAPVDLFSGTEQPPSVGTVAMVQEVDVVASAGAGSVVDHENDGQQWAFPAGWVRAELSAPVSDLRIITIEGDSMQSDPPRRGDLEPGDKVIVNIAARSPTPPGIFIVHDGIGLVAKRVMFLAGSDPHAVRLVSNNSEYPAYELTAEEVHIIGRVVGRWQRL